jgi:hypothetical protein
MLLCVIFCIDPRMELLSIRLVYIIMFINYVVAFGTTRSTTHY